MTGSLQCRPSIHFHFNAASNDSQVSLTPDYHYSHHPLPSSLCIDSSPTDNNNQPPSSSQPTATQLSMSMLWLLLLLLLLVGEGNATTNQPQHYSTPTNHHWTHDPKWKCLQRSVCTKPNQPIMLFACSSGSVLMDLTSCQLSLMMMH